MLTDDIVALLSIAGISLHPEEDSGILGERHAAGAGYGVRGGRDAVLGRDLAGRDCGGGRQLVGAHPAGRNTLYPRHEPHLQQGGQGPALLVKETFSNESVILTKTINLIRKSKGNGIATENDVGNARGLYAVAVLPVACLKGSITLDIDIPIQFVSKYRHNTSNIHPLRCRVET